MSEKELGIDVTRLNGRFALIDLWKKERKRGKRSALFSVTLTQPSPVEGEDITDFALRPAAAYLSRHLALSKEKV